MKRGDGAAFVSLVDQFGPLVLRLARRYSDGCEADAEDLAQEIFVALCRGIGSFRGEAKLSTYVYRVAINHCLKSAGRRCVGGQSGELDDVIPAGVEHDPETYAERGELKSKIGEALASLSEGHREVVILHEMHGLTSSECAAVLGVPVGTVKSRLFTAFGRLRLQLRDYVGGDGVAARTRESSQSDPARPGENVAPFATAGIGKLL